MYVQVKDDGESQSPAVMAWILVYIRPEKEQTSIGFSITRN
jgi:hypothetical protein